MSDIDSVSTGDFASVVEDEEVVVEGDVIDVRRNDEKVTVEIEEGSGDVIEYVVSKDRQTKTMGRRRDGSVSRTVAVPVSNDAVLEAEV